MKRVLLTMALCVAASTSFAQKKAVTQAQRFAKANENFDEARTLIKGALENEETKNDPKTWYVAGFVEDQQFSSERTKQILGQKPDEAVMYTALDGVFPFFVKAYELDQQPNEKGKVKPRYTKDIKSITSANHVYYINAGSYYFDKQEYKKAYDSFEQYIEISDHPMFAGETTAARDSNFMTVQFYAAVSATQLKDSKLAIAALERAKGTDFRRNDIYQYLCYEYEQAKDTVSFERILEEGLVLFPEEEYYLMALINNYIYSNRNEKAVEYLNKAIAIKPENTQLYNVMGRVYETGLKDFVNAELFFNKALEIDPNNAEATANIGRIFYNQAVNQQGKANEISDAKLYQEELEKAKDLFRKALPYFEKAHEANAEERDYITALRGIYYNLDMGDEFEKMDAKMNQ